MARTLRFAVAVCFAGSEPGRGSSVRKTIVLAFLMAASSFFPLHAQFFDASSVGGSVTITAPWRFHTGDDLQWASPTFDDSQWPLLRMDKRWNVQRVRDNLQFAWYRIRLQLPASKEQLALGLDWVADSEEIYADGQLIAEMGQMRPEPVWQSHLPGDTVVVPLPPSLYGRTIELAVRAWLSPHTVPQFGAGAAPSLGTLQTIRELHRLSAAESLLGFLSDLIVFIVALVIGQISFGLFLLRPSAAEYLWAGLYLFAHAAIRGFDFYRQAHQIPVHESTPVIYAIGGFSTICWFFLVWGFIHARKDRLFYTGIFLALCIPLATFLVLGGMATVSTIYIVRASVTVCIGLLIFTRLAREAWRGNRDAQVFLVPFLLYTVMDAVRFIRGSLYYAGSFRTPTPTGPALYKGAYFTVTWDRVSFLLAFLAIGAVLVRRFAETAQQEQRLATEMESARQVQAQLVPMEFPRLSDFHIEAAYLPASEVGGDFYQVFEQNDGSVVIVVGDVCGKGLKAAMTGVLAIGVARALASQGLPPGLLLSRFNREMVASQNGGFITCICAHVCRDGAITLANAGHPPPYRNGEEIQLKSSLPLGITPDVEYAETSAKLAHGDSITFLSDGVVEARSETGGVFGFDRTREISKQPARAIANAAQQFGQEDDITVLTLSFTHPDAVPA